MTWKTSSWPALASNRNVVDVPRAVDRAEQGRGQRDRRILERIGLVVRLVLGDLGIGDDGEVLEARDAQRGGITPMAASPRRASGAIASSTSTRFGSGFAGGRIVAESPARGCMHGGRPADADAGQRHLDPAAAQAAARLGRVERGVANQRRRAAEGCRLRRLAEHQARRWPSRCRRIPEGERPVVTSQRQPLAVRAERQRLDPVGLRRERLAGA